MKLNDEGNIGFITDARQIENLEEPEIYLK